MNMPSSENGCDEGSEAARMRGYEMLGLARPGMQGLDGLLVDSDDDQEITLPGNNAMNDLVNQIQSMSRKESVLKARLNELELFAKSEANETKRKIEEIRTRRAKVKDALQWLQAGPLENPLPREPQSLHFVEGNAFLCLGYVVIIANLVILVKTKIDADYRNNYETLNACLNQAFMVFYALELILRALLWKHQLLFGACSFVIWNWMDVVIVMAGAVELWIMPLLRAEGILSQQGDWISYFRVLRACRLLRILKLVRQFLKSDLSWVSGDRFQMAMMIVIAVNCVLIGLECDYEDFFFWVFVEQALLLTFAFELLVRIKCQRCQFFISRQDFAWNWLDLVIVSGGIVDQWMMPGISLISRMLSGNTSRTQATGNMGKVMMMLRMARLLRILRLVRLIHSIPPLYQLIVSIAEAMMGMLWVLVLTMIMLYIFALLAVRLVAHGLVFGGTAPEEVQAIFPSVRESIFVLFQVMNGDTGAIQPLFKVLPSSEPVFMFFTIVSSWAVLSILTAVINENMIQSAEQHRNEVNGEITYKNARRNREILEKVFNEYDADGNGTVEEDEYNNMIDDPFTLLKLKRATGLDRQDLQELFRHLSRNEAQIDKEDFTEGLLNEHRPVTERDIIRLEKRLVDMEVALDHRVDDIVSCAPPDMPEDDE